LFGAIEKNRPSRTANMAVSCGHCFVSSAAHSGIHAATPRSRRLAYEFCTCADPATFEPATTQPWLKRPSHCPTVSRPCPVWARSGPGLGPVNRAAVGNRSGSGREAVGKRSGSGREAVGKRSGNGRAVVGTLSGSGGWSGGRVDSDYFFENFKGLAWHSNHPPVVPNLVSKDVPYLNGEVSTVSVVANIRGFGAESIGPICGSYVDASPIPTPSTGVVLGRIPLDRSHPQKIQESNMSGIQPEYQPRLDLPRFDDSNPPSVFKDIVPSF
jgi:hypothetical protein